MNTVGNMYISEVILQMFHTDGFQLIQSQTAFSFFFVLLILNVFFQQMLLVFKGLCWCFSSLYGSMKAYKQDKGLIGLAVVSMFEVL